MKINGTHLGIVLILVFFTVQAFAEPIVHKFKNPSFSGIGTGAHYLTIENQSSTA
jgi:hypothetical protein